MPVTYQLKDSVATITMDDGKVNVMSIAMLSALNTALDRAVSDHAVVVLTGRPGVFSAGFDLPVLTAGGADARKLLITGFELAHRLLSFPTPVVVACNGHAIAMGVFLLLAADYRLGVDGPYKIRANEVAIGLTMPHFGVEICRQRLAPAHFNRAVILSEMFTPADAVPAGFLDRVVSAAELQDEAQTVAAAMTKLNMSAHAATKLRVREQTLKATRAAIEADNAPLSFANEHRD
jgi:enoyl-CoA hydratase